MQSLIQHWRRITFTLVPLVFALLHAADVLPIELLHRLDDAIYDLRMRATLPGTLDERIVIVDIDEKSLAEMGHWPWGRDKLAALTRELFERQQVGLAGFDIFFTEPDESSGLKQLQLLAQNEFKGQPGFADKLAQLQPQLDYDALFAQSLKDRPVVLGYFFSADRSARVSGVLPAPVMEPHQLRGRKVDFTLWPGYGANIAVLAQAAPLAGHANPQADSDGVMRSTPLLAEYRGKYYESLALAMFRLALRSPTGLPTVSPGFAQERFVLGTAPGLESVNLRLDKNNTYAIPVDARVATLVPFRGKGGVAGGSFRYVSATDLVHQRLAAQSLKGKVILVGTTAAGLLDLRVTPVGEVYPGVEAHANLLSGLMDDRMLVKPDFSPGFEFGQLLLTGLLLAIALPMLKPARAVALSLVVLVALVGVNLWAYLAGGLVFPLASALVMAVTAFALNMSYGYFVESRSKRELAQLFGTYVPPELVDEMVKEPEAYSMQAVNRELTVMFCDMRGFTKMSETMEPTQLQTLLNAIFSRLTQCIRVYRGTIDKYMGDCVMAFWGAPVVEDNHAALAVQAALDMAQAVHAINQEPRASGAPTIGIGIGLNSGNMCVGDMGSDIRRSYTVVGDAVNLGSRLEGLSKEYGVDIVASESTRRLAPDFAWQELDRVRVKGKNQAVQIYTPRGAATQLTPELTQELKIWSRTLRAYRQQDWDACDVELINLQRLHADSRLYALYAARVAAHRAQPPGPAWDGTTHFDTK